jgi:hypothetical protein
VEAQKEHTQKKKKKQGSMVAQMTREENSIHFDVWPGMHAHNARPSLFHVFLHLFQEQKTKLTKTTQKFAVLDQTIGMGWY